MSTAAFSTSKKVFNVPKLGSLVGQNLGKVAEKKSPIKVASIPSQIGKNLKHVSPMEKMPIEYTIPEINDDKCLQCGRCFLACSDSGYQAITFKGSNNVPVIVEEDCTGCAICHAVCPVENAIKMVPRVSEYIPSRGIPQGPECPP